MERLRIGASYRQRGRSAMGEFRGVTVPLIAPLDPSDDVDHQALRDQIERLIDGGVHALVANGSTGEAISLSREEVNAVNVTTISQVRGRVPVIVGCTANATRDVIGLVKAAQGLGADGFLVTHPYYSHPDESELFRHYEAISAQLDRPMIVYNNPFVTGIDASPELLIRICGLPHMDYIKESSGDVSRVARISHLSPDRPLVLCGSDNLALESFSAGAVGWVAACGNVIPAECVKLYELAVVQKDMAAAQEVYERIYPLFDLAERTGKFVQISKAGVELRGGRAGQPRAPLQPLSAVMQEQLRSVLDAIGS